MKDLVNKLIGNLHFFIILYGLYGAWVMYDEHQAKVEALNNQFPAVKSEIDKAKRKVKEIQDFVKQTEESKVRVEEVAKNIEAAQRQLPAEINDNQILTFLNQEINSLNIKDPNIVPGSEKKSTYFISKDYTLKAKGTFLQLMIFFERLGSAARIYNVKNLKLINADSGQRGRFQIINAESVIEAFRYNPDFKVDREIEKVDKKSSVREKL